LPIFEKQTGIKVDVVAVGTGAAIEIGKRGDADVVMVHAKQQELKAVEEGAFVNRHDLMYNDFVIIAPRTTPEDQRHEVHSRRLQEDWRPGQSPLCFPGRQVRHPHHGTGHLEKGRLDPKARSGYLEWQGMEKTQRIANEKKGYTLTDRGTWLATKDKDKLDMAWCWKATPFCSINTG